LEVSEGIFSTGLLSKVVTSSSGSNATRTGTRLGTHRIASVHATCSILHTSLLLNSEKAV
jgi:hypothetical protein